MADEEDESSTIHIHASERRVIRRDFDEGSQEQVEVDCPGKLAARQRQTVVLHSDYEPLETQVRRQRAQALVLPEIHETVTPVDRVLLARDVFDDRYVRREGPAVPEADTRDLCHTLSHEAL